MPRVNTVKSARKPQGKCSRCDAELEVGSPYIWWQFRFGPKYKRCTEPTCRPRRSELTRSEILSAAYSVEETYADDISKATCVGDLEDIQQNAASDVEAIVELIQDKLDNIESGCGHTDLPVYEELDERRGMYEEWQQEIEGVDFADAPPLPCAKCHGDGHYVETCYGGNLVKECPTCSGTGEGAEDDGDTERSDEPWEEWLQEQRDALLEAVGNCPE